MNKSDKQIVQKIIAGAAIIHDDKLLIIQRSSNEEIYPNLWELPSGKKEALESPENAVIREVREETGLNIEVVAPVAIFDYQIEESNEIKDSTQINFLARPRGQIDIVLSGEHRTFAWVERKDLEKYDLTDSIKNVIKKAFWLHGLAKKQES